MEYNTINSILEKRLIATTILFMKLIKFSLCNSKLGSPTNLSDLHLLHLTSSAKDSTDSNIPSIHSTAMFISTTLFSVQYNVSVQGQFIAGLIADTMKTGINAIAGIGTRIGIPVISYILQSILIYQIEKLILLWSNSSRWWSNSAVAIAQLFLRYNWTSCIIVCQNDASGIIHTSIITNMILKHGLKIKNSLILDIVIRRKRHNFERCLYLELDNKNLVIWITSYTTTIFENAVQ